MKKLLYIIAGVFALNTTAVQAQKIGHVNSQELLAALPEYKTAEAEMKKWQTERMAEYEKLKASLQGLYDKYSKEKNSPVPNQINLQTLETDIQARSQDIERFEQTTEETAQKKEQIYMEPLIKKVKDAIAGVAKEQGINYVLDTGTLIYQEGGNDLNPAVKKKLGIVIP